MGIIQTSLPQTVSASVHSNLAQNTTRAETNASVNNTASQPAVIVSLSQESKSRAVSSGSNKFVDSTYGSEKYNKDKKDKSSIDNKSNIKVLA